MKKKIAYLLLLLMLIPVGSFAKEKRTFEIKDGHFYVNGKVTPILSGEMHYPRIPHQYWRHRLRMMRAMGLNTVATYVFWNLHETEPGKWDFEGDKNLAEYIRIAGEEGLMVILRPGPYVCAEWEFGGYPWWLQNIPGMEIRRDNPEFLKRTKLYIDKLYEQVGDLQVSKGGPIIMVQAENEFGSYVAQRKDIPLEEHRRYNAKIKRQLADAGFNVPLFTSDGSWLFEGGSTPGALPTANGESNVENLKKVVNEYHGGVGPYMVAEFYPGWLMHWAEPFPDISDSGIARQTETYLQNDVSFNFYMVHGGTNFGFTSGANYDKKHDIQPDLTSYDYDAPISEAGWVTPKFDSIRNVIRKYVTYDVPEAPAPIPLIEIPSISLTKVADVLALAKEGEPVASPTPLTFEQLNQGYGPVKINGSEISDWKMYKLPMDRMPALASGEPYVYKNGSPEVAALGNKPVLYEGTFHLSDTGDTFIDMEDWGKGIIFINGINIGRYWYAGPQQTLYIPGVWLNKGENKIVIYEQLNNDRKSSVRTVKTPVLTKLKKITAMEKKNRLMDKAVSPFSVDETMRRIEEIIKSQGGSVFAVFDHGRNASEVGMKLPPNKVIVFGSPKVGTLLMQQDPSISLELPLRISVWEDADGKVWIGSPNLETIASEYGMENSGVIEKMQEAVTNIVSKSIAGSR